MSLLKDYIVYQARNEEYQAKRKELLRGPEMELHNMAVDLEIYTLRDRVNKEAKRLQDKGWKLYRKIYSGDPTDKDIERFLDIANILIQCKELFSEEQLAVWRVSLNLIEAYQMSFVGTKDERDQMVAFSANKKESL